MAGDMIQMEFSTNRSITGRIPCPFCGSTQLALIVYGANETPLCIQCKSCGATGPHAKTTPELDALWDTRAQER